MATYTGGRARPRRLADHDPNAIDLFEVDWSDWLAEVNDTIAASQWVLPSGLTSETEAFSDTTASIEISGGTVGTTYTVTNRITTASLGLVQDRSFYTVCREF